MKILSIIAVIYITFESYKFLPKYFRLRFKGIKCDGEILELVNSQWSFGVLPKVKYQVEDRYYKLIIPIHSSFVARNNFYIGNKVQLFVNPKNLSECVVKSDLLVLAQIIVAAFLYSIGFYFFLNETV